MQVACVCFRLLSERQQDISNAGYDFNPSLSPPTTHCLLLIAYYSSPTPHHYPSLTTHGLLLHYSRPTTPYYPSLTTHYYSLLPIAYYSLLLTSYYYYSLLPIAYYSLLLTTTHGMLLTTTHRQDPNFGSSLRSQRNGGR